ncbi:DUF7683 domain-containing protein [Streptomyces acidiscabies]|uniref:DUF7683 domain-containing protein n=1 Tax=Streptomyces acidiscabies TaxID=42234 RepID=UPI003BB05FBD
MGDGRVRRKDEDFTDDRWDVTHLGDQTIAEVFHITHPDHLGDVYRVTAEQAAKLAPLTSTTWSRPPTDPAHNSRASSTSYPMNSNMLTPLAS